MKDEDKTREQLINELVELRQRVAELETSESERKRAEEEIRQRNRELAALNAITSAMMQSALDLDEVLQRTADGIVEGLGCNTAFIFLLDEKEGIFKGGAVSTKAKILGRINAIIGFPLVQIKFPARRDFNEAVSNLLDGRATIKHDFHELVRPLLSRPACFAMQGLLDSRTFFAMPLLAKGKTVGGIIASTREELSEGDTETMMTFANQAAIAIENARLYEAEQKRRHVADTLRQVATVLSSTLDLRGVLDLILEQLDQVVPYDSASVMLVSDPSTGSGQAVLRVMAARGFPDVERTMQVTIPVADDVLFQEMLRTRQPVVLADAQKDERFLAAGETTYVRGWIGAPLVVKGRVIGNLTVDSRKPGAYGQEEAEIVAVFANQAAIAIENARLFEAERERSTQLAAVARVAERIASILNPDELLREAVELITHTFGYYYAAIMLLDAEANELVFKVGAGGYAGRTPAGFRQKVKEGMIGWVAHLGKTVWANDVSQEPRYIPAYLPETRSELDVPLKYHDRVIGVLDLQSKELNAFTQHDVMAMETLAGHVAAAIENARLFEEERRRIAQLAAIGEVGRDIASILDLDELLHRVVSLLVEVFGYYYANVLMVDEEAQEIVITATAGQTGRAFEGLRLNIGEQGITGWVAGSGEPLLVNDVGKEPRYYSVEELVDTKSELAVPIKLKGEVIGVLDVQSNEPVAFDEVDLSTLTTLADQLAVAIENARLYQETERLAITDGLTGLYNRRHFYELLEREVESVKRYDGQISLIMLDIDDFKVYNDTYGHLVGDTLLKELARLLTRDIRKVDIAARYGGDEFVILFPHTGKKEAVALAERIRTSVEEYKFWGEEALLTGEASSRLSRTIAVSVGVSTCPEDAVVEPEALVRAADMALLEAKKWGNRVCACSSLG